MDNPGRPEVAIIMQPVDAYPDSASVLHSFTSVADYPVTLRFKLPRQAGAR